MVGHRTTENNFMIVRYSEGTVILGQAFIEPGRDLSFRVVDQQMSVLMKNYTQRICTRRCFNFERDVIDVETRLKITGRARIRLKRPVSIVISKHDDPGGNRCVDVVIRKQPRCDFTELLETL